MYMQIVIYVYHSGNYIINEHLLLSNPTVTHTCIYIHIHTHTCIYTYMFSHTYMYTYIHPHTCIHIYHTYIHPYLPIYPYTHVPWSHLSLAAPSSTVYRWSYASLATVCYWITLPATPSLIYLVYSCIQTNPYIYVCICVYSVS